MKVVCLECNLKCLLYSIKNLRVVGLKEESTYGQSAESFTPDWHKYISKSSFALNDEAILFGDGSRMNSTARPGIIKPTGSVKSKVDLKTIGHLFRAFLDQYEYTEDAGETGLQNIHEFWGAESSELTSFTGCNLKCLLYSIKNGNIKYFQC